MTSLRAEDWHAQKLYCSVQLEMEKAFSPTKVKERTHEDVLVQREVESWRAPVASITLFSLGHFAPPNAVAAGGTGSR